MNINSRWLVFCPRTLIGNLAIYLLSTFSTAHAALVDVNLGAASDFSVFAVTGKLQMSNSQTTVNGNIAVGQGGTENVSEGTVTGNYYAHITCSSCDGNNLTSLGGSFFQDSATDTLLEQAAMDVTNAQLAMGGLTPTQTFGTINNATISSTTQYNVININEIVLSGGNNLTLSGSASEYFFINVRDQMSLSGDASILLSGGLTPTTVIFNIATDLLADNLTQTGSSQLFGTYLVSGRYNNSGATLTGQVMAKGISAAESVVLVSGSDVNFVPFSPVPIPGAIWLFGSALAFLGWISHRRRVAA